MQKPLTVKEEKPHFYHIDFLRFFFALTICYCHTYQIVPPFYDIPMSNILLKGYYNSQIATDFFFVLAGFFLIYKIPENLGDFLKKRLIRLLPAFCIALIFCIVLSSLKIHFYPDSFKNINFIGLLPNILLIDYFSGQSILGISWFIDCLFWGSLFYFCLNRQMKVNNFLLFISFLAFLSFCILCVSGIDLEIFYLGILKVGLIRSLAGIGLGILIYYIYRTKLTNKNFSYLATFLEILLIVYLMQGLFITPFFDYANLLVAFGILFYLFLINKGFVSRVLNKRFWGFFGAISYMLFLIHMPAFSVLKAILYLYHMPASPFVYMFYLVSLSVLISIVFYLVFERPILRYLNKSFLKKTYRCIPTVTYETK